MKNRGVADKVQVLTLLTAAIFLFPDLILSGRDVVESPKDSRPSWEGGHSDKIYVPVLEYFDVASLYLIVCLKVFAYEDSWPLFCSAGTRADRHLLHQMEKSHSFHLLFCHFKVSVDQPDLSLL